MFHLNDKFRGVLTPAKWRNKVSAWLNNFCGDGIVKVSRPDDPSPTTPPAVSLDIEKLTEVLSASFDKDYTFKLKIGTDNQNQRRVLIYLGVSPAVRIAGEDRAISAGVSAASDGWYYLTGATFIDWSEGFDVWIRQRTDSGYESQFGIYSAKLADANKVSVCLGRIVGTDVYQNTLGAITLQNAYLGKGSTDTAVAIDTAPASSVLWDRDSDTQMKTAKKNFVVRVLSCVKSMSEAYCYRVSFTKLEFDRDGRLYKASREAENQYFDLVDYDYIRDLG